MTVAVTVKEGSGGGGDGGGAAGGEVDDDENRDYNNKGIIYGILTACPALSKHLICSNFLNHF